MARHNDVHYNQDKFIPVSFQKPILPVTIEHTLSYLFDHELERSASLSCPSAGRYTPTNIENCATGLSYVFFWSGRMAMTSEVNQWRRYA
jgi:hypothetical protein